MAFVAVPCVAQRDYDTHSDRRECRHHRPRYYVGNDDVYFEGRKIEGASASSFSILHDGYAKDTWTVYYNGIKIDGASADSFKVLGTAMERTHGMYIIMAPRLMGLPLTALTYLKTGMPKTRGMYITTA